MIARAKEWFSSSGDVVRVKDCLYLLARLYHDLALHQVSLSNPKSLLYFLIDIGCKLFNVHFEVKFSKSEGQLRPEDFDFI